MTAALLAGTALLGGCRGDGNDGRGESATTVTEAAPEAPSTTSPSAVLLFTRTEQFRHDVIPAAAEALTSVLEDRGYTVTTTEDPAELVADRLPRYRAVVFLLTTGDVLGDEQQDALEAWLRAGGSWVGVHAAADTEYEWPFYGELAGAWFARHPAVQPAEVVVEDPTHASTSHLPARWARTDEWYDFRTNPRGSVHVLAAVDEATYEGGGMGADHPIVWCHAVDEGRAFYTGLGHDAAAWADEAFVAHVAGGVDYAAAAPGTGCG